MELKKEIEHKLLFSSEELDGIATATEPLNPEQLMDLFKGCKFTFSLDADHVKEYLIVARKISEKILKRTEVQIDRGIATIKEHLTEVYEPQYRSVFLMRLY